MALLIVAFSGCVTTGSSVRSGSSGESRAENHSRDGEHSEAAGIYIGLAANAAGEERDRLTLLAVEQCHFRGIENIRSRVPLSRID